MSYKQIAVPHIDETSLPAEKFSHHGMSSIPGVHLPPIDIHDNLLEQDLHYRLWDYLERSEWHHVWHEIGGELQVYRPCDGDSWINGASIRRTLSQPRALFGSNETSLQRHHPLVYELWCRINERLGNQWSISGIIEDMHLDAPAPDTEDPDLETGWRVYANATPHDLISLGGYIHRDNKNLTDDSTATIIWVANKEWYPSWGGELMTYPEDPDGLTGDYQQFNSPIFHQQKRGFHIGWADEGKLISLRPNRLICMDSRTLHATTPSRRRWNDQPIRRFVFRARRKSP